MKKIVLSLAVLTLYVLAHQGDVAAQETTTRQIAGYGIELTLPSRWKLSDLSEKNKPTRKQKRVLIVKATDDEGEANILFYARREHRRKTIDEWMQTRQIPRFLEWYSEGSGYTENGEPRQKQVSVASGQNITVEYRSLDINNNEREVAFAYFAHNGYYFYLFISNRGAQANIDRTVERVILPGLKLL